MILSADNIQIRASSDRSYNNGVKLFEAGCVRNLTVDIERYPNLSDDEPGSTSPFTVTIEADVIPSLRTGPAMSPDSEWYPPRGHAKDVKMYGVYISFDEFGFHRHLTCKCKGDSDIHDDPEWTGCCSHIVAVQLAAGKWLAEKGFPGME